MRKVLFAMIALSACALVACNKQETAIPEENAETVEMTVIAGDASTKTAFSGSSIVWRNTETKKEKLKVIEAITGGAHDGKFYNYDSAEGETSDGGETMTFGVSLSSHSEATSFQYVAFYPSTAYQAVTNLTNIAVNTPYEQTPSTTSFDPAADLLISQVSDATTTQPTSINMAFARKVAIGKMTIKNLESSEDVTSVTFSAKKNVDEVLTDVVLAGRSKIDFTTSTVNYGSNIQQKTLVMDLSEDSVKMNGEEGAPVYFVCYPFELSTENAGEFTVVVETATQRFTKNVTLTGTKTLAFTAGNVASFSVDMDEIAGVAKAVSLHYAEFTKDDAYGAEVTGNTYTVFDIEKGHKDKWAGKVSYYNGGFGLRNTSSTNDSYLKLPDFVEKIMTVTVELSQAFVHNTNAEIDTYLSLETASNISTKSISSQAQVDDQMTYVFDISASDYKTAYLRATGNPAYIKKVSVTTAKTDDRTQLAAPTGVTAALHETNDITVSWTKATNAVGYEIVCTPSEGDAVVTEVDDVDTYTVEGLANNTTYTVTIYSIPDYYVNTKSVAASSTPATVTTTKGASYVLEAVKASSNNSYAATYNVTINGKQWSAPGNQNFDGYWRIGGSSSNCNSANRVIYSKEVITTDNISRVVINTNGKSRASITVNSTTLEVYDTADHAKDGGETGRVAILTNTDSDWSQSTSKTITFNKADETSWASKYFRITFNITNSNSSNGGIDFQNANFFE